MYVLTYLPVSFESSKPLNVAFGTLKALFDYCEKCEVRNFSVAYIPAPSEIDKY